MARRIRQTDNLIDYSDIEIYEMVRSGGLHTFPKDFWIGINALDSAKDITRYLFEKILKWSIDDIKVNPLSDVFYDNRLGSMLKNLFNDSIYEAIINAYPELEEWASKTYKRKTIYDGGDAIQYEDSNTIRYTDEELIEKLQSKAKELGRNPFGREMSSPDVSVYIRQFGTWEKALIAAELLEDIYKDVDESKEAEENTKKVLKEFTLEKDRMPNQEEILTLITEGEVKTYFRSFAGVCQYLETEYTKEELKRILKSKYKKLGRIPTGRDMTVPRAIVFIDMFGNWNTALKESGIMD